MTRQVAAAFLSARWRRPPAGRGAWIVLLGVVLAGCGGSGPEAETGAVALADSALVPILVDLHLADARAETTGEPADSLRRDALSFHGLDSTALTQRIVDATRAPEDASALYQAVTDRLQATGVETSDPSRP